MLLDATEDERELSPDRAWWLRVPAVFLSPRSVFFALRDDDPEDVAARSEPVLLLVLLAGIAAVLATPTAGALLDKPDYDALLVAGTLVSGSEGAMRVWLSRGWTPDEAADRYVRLCLGAIRALEGARR